MLKKKAQDPVIICFDDALTFLFRSQVVTPDTTFRRLWGLHKMSSIHISKERHFANLPILAVIALDGQKCNLTFLHEGDRQNSASYIEYLQKDVVPRARSTFGDN